MKHCFFRKVFLTAVLLCASFTFVLFGVNAIRADAWTYDTAKWKNGDEETVMAENDGSVNVSGGMYYTENLGDKEKLERDGAITVSVEFSYKNVPYPANAMHFLWFIGAEADSFAQLSGDGAGVGPGSPAIGARMYYQSNEQVETGRLLFRCCDPVNDYRTADYFNGFGNGSYSGKHVVSWTITSEGVTMYIDGNALRTGKNGASTPYYPEKKAGSRFTLDDFLDDDGNPVVYFGCIDGGFADVTIHKVGNGVDYVYVDDFEGAKEALYEKNNQAYLTDGEAHTVSKYNFNALLSGSFAVEEVPAYVYDGVADEDKESVIKTYFNVNLVDSLQDGYGLRIAWKPLSQTGEVKTEIEFGYLTPDGYTCYKTESISTPTVGMHTYAFFAGNGYFKLVADGLSVYISTKADNKLFMLGEYIDKESTTFSFVADDKYDEAYTGKWCVALNGVTAVAPTDDYITDSVGTQLSGVLALGEKVYDYRTYEMITENKTVTVNGGAVDSGIFFNEPVKLFSKLDVNVKTSVQVQQIPAYISEEDCYIQLSFSNIIGGTTGLASTQTAFFVQLRWKDANTLQAFCKMGAITQTYTVACAVTDEIDVELGWNENGSVILINGKVALEGELTKGNFGTKDGIQGYFAVRTYNGVSDENAKWAYTLSAPVHVDATLQTGQGNGTDGESGCKSSASVGVLFAAGAVVFALSKKRKD